MRDRSTRRSTFDATLLTFWPPGPEERTARKAMASAGTTMLDVTCRGSLTVGLFPRL
jgi:hypothetical protein